MSTLDTSRPGEDRDPLDDLDGTESVVPTRCSHGCEVEPDGTCPHGYDSVLLEAGLI